MKPKSDVSNKIESLFEEIGINEETMASFGAMNMLPVVDKALQDFKKADYYDLKREFDPVINYLMKLKKHLERVKARKEKGRR